MRKSRASYLKVPTDNDRYIAFATVGIESSGGDPTTVKGDELAEALIHAFAELPTQAGNVSSSRDWSQRNTRTDSGFERVGRVPMAAWKAAKVLRDEGIQAQKLDAARFSSNVEVAYTVEMPETEEDFV